MASVPFFVGLSSAHSKTLRAPETLPPLTALCKPLLVPLLFHPHQPFLRMSLPHFPPGLLQEPPCHSSEHELPEHRCGSLKMSKHLYIPTFPCKGPLFTSLQGRGYSEDMQVPRWVMLPTVLTSAKLAPCLVPFPHLVLVCMPASHLISPFLGSLFCYHQAALESPNQSCQWI